MLQTARLTLRPWRQTDRAALAAMCRDPDVMWDYGHVFTQDESDLRFTRYSETYARLGFCRWLVERRDDGRFLGYCGIQPILGARPVPDGVEIGWRMIRAAWGQGFASEAAREALRDGFERCGLPEVWSFTATDNARSEAVMRRIGLVHAPARGYTDPPGKSWVVYVTRGPA